MEASIGDRVSVVYDEPHGKERAAKIIDIRDTSTGQETYLVEWSDNGHRQLVQLGPGSRIKRAG